LVRVVVKNWLVGLVGFLLGGLVVLGIRFFSYHPATTHYHANFAVFTNGQREQFKDAFYYEAVGASCSADKNMTPHERAHMHDNVNDVVHVHDHAVTWGQFFMNLGWDVNPLFVKTPQTVLLADSTHKVTFILNGQVAPNIQNQVIGDKDKLLVDYGSGSQTALDQEYKIVPGSAAQYDVSKDPASCGGSAAPTFHDRLTHLF